MFHVSDPKVRATIRRLFGPVHHILRGGSRVYCGQPKPEMAITVEVAGEFVEDGDTHLLCQRCYALMKR